MEPIPISNEQLAILEQDGEPSFPTPVQQQQQDSRVFASENYYDVWQKSLKNNQELTQRVIELGRENEFLIQKLDELFKILDSYKEEYFQPISVLRLKFLLQITEDPTVYMRVKDGKFQGFINEKEFQQQTQKERS